MRFFLCAVLSLLFINPVFAQEEIIDTVNIPADIRSLFNSIGGHRFFDGRLSAMTNIRLSMFQLISQRYSHRDERINWERDSFNFTIFNIGPVDRNFFEDAHITVAYEAERFGGKISVDGGGLGGFMAWVQFTPWFRLSAGDIDAEFADPLGADPGMRVYTGTTRGAWNSWINPDNIQGEQGLMLDFFLGPLTMSGVATTNEITDMIYSRPREWDGEVIMSRFWEYSGRIGYDIGRWGSANISYNISYESTASRFTDRGEGLRPNAPHAEVFRHNIGAFASLIPLEDIAVTLGWAANITNYLDAFVPTGGGVEMIGVQQTTTWPRIFRQGININARYTGIPRITIRTDHNFSFWNDKDYRIFGLILPGVPDNANFNITSTIVGGEIAEVEHRILWNGLGVFFHLDDHWNVGIYGRNLRRTSRAGEHWMILNETTVEPRLTWRLNENIEFFAALNYTILVERVSAFTHRNRPQSPFDGEPRDTRDINQTFSVPFGFTMRL